ncbi:hypothetical protein E2562_021448 [Oryza meyeriana var. granulata]|uniref:Uncharacterized protein n=1 Tax=Oryza meyeriana var. granulata TaxID=110450 RepID=A0A6G1C9L1_9ORYZ|nr:hypothetical protein E2562_021448 [Oryza meyeriana var. granulata]
MTRQYARRFARPYKGRTKLARNGFYRRGKPGFSGLGFLRHNNMVLLVRVCAAVPWLCEMCLCKVEEAVKDVSSRILLRIKARYPATQPFVVDTNSEDYDTNKHAEAEAEAERIVTMVAQEIGWMGGSAGGASGSGSGDCCSISGSEDDEN